MSVEFVGMIGTRDVSETRAPAGPPVDPAYVRRFARAHEEAGFDRVLIGYGSSTPDGTQVAAYASRGETPAKPKPFASSGFAPSNGTTVSARPPVNRTTGTVP